MSKKKYFSIFFFGVRFFFGPKVFFQGPGRGGMVFLYPLEMIPPIRNLDRSFLASPAQSRPGVRRVVQGVRRGGLFCGAGRVGMVFLDPLEMIPPLRNLD